MCDKSIDSVSNGVSFKTRLDFLTFYAGQTQKIENNTSVDAFADKWCIWYLNPLRECNDWPANYQAGDRLPSHHYVTLNKVVSAF